MDPINPIAGNPEALNQNPEPPKDNHWITIASMAVFVLLSLAAVAFLYYQNQQFKSLLASYQTPAASPTPIATTDPTANWKTYTFEGKLTFSYPPNYILKEQVLKGQAERVVLSSDETLTTDSDVISIDVRDDIVYKNLDEAITQSKRGLTDVEEKEIENGILISGKVWDVSKTISEDLWIAAIETNFGILTPLYSGRKEGLSTFLEILSTFKFTGPVASPSASPVACTQEAKLCPNGSYVGRTGPNCEFAPCPTSY